MFSHPELVFGWRSAILLVAVLQLLLAAGLLLRRSFDQTANRILALFLVVTAGMLTPQMIGFAGFYDAFPWLSFAPFDNGMAIGPLLLAYTFSLTRGRIPRLFWYLMIPAVMAFLHSSYWFLQPLEQRWDWVERVQDPYIQPSINAIGITLAIACVLVSLIETRRYRRWLDQATSVRAEFDPRWLSVALGVFIIAVAVWSMRNLLHVFWQPLSYAQEYPAYLVLAAASYAIAQLALIRGQAPFPKMPVQLGVESVLEPIHNRTLRGQAEALRQWTKERELYLEPRLTIADLARRRASNQSEISRLINQGLGVNFNRFINELRIEHAQQQLREGSDDILAIALASGFNAKATFNRVFREITGITPTEYRNRVSNQPELV